MNNSRTPPDKPRNAAALCRRGLDGPTIKLIPLIFELSPAPVGNRDFLRYSVVDFRISGWSAGKLLDVIISEFDVRKI